MTRDDFYMIAERDEDPDDRSYKMWYEMYYHPAGGVPRFVGHIGWSPYGDGPSQQIVNEWIDNYIEEHSTGTNQ